MRMNLAFKASCPLQAQIPNTQEVYFNPCGVYYITYFTRACEWNEDILIQVVEYFCQSLPHVKLHVNVCLCWNNDLSLAQSNISSFYPLFTCKCKKE